MRSQAVFPEADTKDVAHRATRDEANGGMFWWMTLPYLSQKLWKRCGHGDGTFDIIPPILGNQTAFAMHISF